MTPFLTYNNTPIYHLSCSPNQVFKYRYDGPGGDDCIEILACLVEYSDGYKSVVGMYPNRSIEKAIEDIDRDLPKNTSLNNPYFAYILDNETERGVLITHRPIVKIL